MYFAIEVKCTMPSSLSNVRERVCVIEGEGERAYVGVCDGFSVYQKEESSPSLQYWSTRKQRFMSVDFLFFVAKHYLHALLYWDSV